MPYGKRIHLFKNIIQTNQEPDVLWFQLYRIPSNNSNRKLLKSIYFLLQCIERIMIINKSRSK